MPIRFIPIPTEIAHLYRNDGTDAYGLTAERITASNGNSTPCRHCLQQVPRNKPYLIVAHRPFDGLNPYTETGPIFICADECTAGGPVFPSQMLTSSQYIIRGYSAGERIIYGTGVVIATEEIESHCERLLSYSDIAFIHIRSASNNCFHCRIERG